MIVNFWASWCVPAGRSSRLVDAAQAHAGDGLEIVGVVWKNDDADAARAFAASHGATWPTVTDPDGSAGDGLAVVAPPQTYFIGRDGILRSRQIGDAHRPDFDRQLAAILP